MSCIKACAALFCSLVVTGCSRWAGSPVTPAEQLRSAGTQRVGSASGYAVLYSFKDDPDGGGPIAALTPVKGRLFGTTVDGGKTMGTVYKLSTTGIETVLHRFVIEPKDVGHPEGNLLALNGTLYGTGFVGGSGKGCCGGVFAIAPSGDERLLYSFRPHDDVSSPRGGLTELAGKMYGAAPLGGIKDLGGGVFEVTAAGKERVVYRFKGPPHDGWSPDSNLIALNGTLYGTAGGGSHNAGVIFSVTPSGTERVLYNFKGGPKDGKDPNALTVLNGTFYGTTQGGGSGYTCGQACGNGAVFSFTPGGKERIIHNFVLSDGVKPAAALLAYNGELYGTTCAGGGYGDGLTCYDRAGYGNGAGTVFRISPSGKYQVIHTFGSQSYDGAISVAPLIEFKGALYGTTQAGGAYGFGTVFRIAP